MLEVLSLSSSVNLNREERRRQNKVNKDTSTVKCRKGRHFSVYVEDCTETQVVSADDKQPVHNLPMVNWLTSR
jgi:hypothetical protein